MTRLIGQSLVKTGALTLLLALPVGSASLAAAHLAQPTGEAAQDVVTALPAAIHPGFCAEGVEPEPAFELGLLGPVAGEDGQVPDVGDIEGFQTSPPVLELEETVDTTLDVLLDQPHALVVHSELDGTDADGYLACAELGGAVEDDELVVGVRPLNNSGYYWIATFEAEGGVPVVGDDRVEVTVQLFQDVGPAGPVGVNEAADDGGTPVVSPTGSPAVDAQASPVVPMATPAAAPVAAQSPSAGEMPTELVVESYDIYFAPARLTIPADTDVTVTLPNLGAAPHNFAIDELGIDVDILPGAIEQTVINAPAGEYEYYCNVPGHRQAGMVGTLIVQ